MSHIIDTLINLDTDHYYTEHKDIQIATRGLSDVDRKLWILNHFVKHGYEEKRKYILKSSQIVDKKTTVPVPHLPTPVTHIKEHVHKSRPTKSRPIVLSRQSSAPDSGSESGSENEQEIQEMINKFRQKHNSDDHCKRDRKVTKPKNLFWEISK